MNTLTKRLQALENALSTPEESTYSLTCVHYLRDGHKMYQLNEAGSPTKDITREEFDRLEPRARYVIERRIVWRPGDTESFMDDDFIQSPGGEGNG